jgi:serine/threonine-protein kinase
MTIERLGPYEIVRRLGRGGMGTVYEGVELQTGQHVAVKLLTVGLSQEPGFRQRFEAEIETLRKLNHPHIVRLLGFGEQDENLFYAMELVPGSSLEEQLSLGRCFNWREAVRIGIEVCLALRHAHDRGVVHRDLKPGNLLSTEDGHVKLSDFGIARLFWNARLTGPGNVLGTAEYMAPEQAEGRPVGPRADLYSLGAVMYVLMARRPVFLGKSFAELVEKQRFAQPDPLRQHAADVPAELEQIIGELLEKDPERRPANALLLSRRLESLERALAVDFAGGEGAGGRGVEDAPAVRAEGNPLATTLPESLPGKVADRAGIPPPPSEGVTEFLPARKPADAARDDQSEEVPLHVESSSSNVLPLTLPGKGGQVPKSPSPAGPPKPAGRFTPVAPGELDRPEVPPPATPWISLHTWALVVGLILVGVVAWYLLQPPSADALYQRITARTESGSSDLLSQAEDDIQQFLVRFPDDSRCELMREHMREIQLNRLDRRLELRAKGLGGSSPLLPIEQDYLEAIGYARLDPDLGIAKLQAILDLYGHQDPAGPAGQCMELAERRMALLRQQVEADAPHHLALLRDRLDRADRLRATQPAQAEAVYRAVIELYQNRPWAAEAVRRARSALAKHP